MKCRIKIKPNGTLEFLGEPPPGFPVHMAERTRFSEILPVPHLRWLAFRIIRWMFGEKGRVSNWTRTWKCRWYCVILRGRQRGAVRISNNRSELLEWEEQVWMNDQN